MTAATATEALRAIETQRIQDAVREVVRWVERLSSLRPAPLPIGEQACVDCGQVRRHMLVVGLPGSSCADFRRCLRCAEAAR
jgi:hypothetical protein